MEWVQQTLLWMLERRWLILFFRLGVERLGTQFLSLVFFMGWKKLGWTNVGDIEFQQALSQRELIYPTVTAPTTASSSTSASPPIVPVIAYADDDDLFYSDINIGGDDLVPEPILSSETRVKVWFDDHKKHFIGTIVSNSEDCLYEIKWDDRRRNNESISLRLVNKTDNVNDAVINISAIFKSDVDRPTEPPVQVRFICVACLRL